MVIVERCGQTKKRIHQIPREYFSLQFQMGIKFVNILLLRSENVRKEIKQNSKRRKRIVFTERNLYPNLISLYWFTERIVMAVYNYRIELVINWLNKGKIKKFL